MANDDTTCSACGQSLRSDEHRRRKLFLYGVVLAWLPFLPIVVGLATAFGGISEQKTTGVGAVAGGLAEIGTIYYLILAPICVVAAFICLARSFSRVHPFQKVLAVISLCWTVVVAGFLALFATALVLSRHR